MNERNDFYEEDEPLEVILAAWEASEKAVIVRPPPPHPIVQLGNVRLMEGNMFMSSAQTITNAVNTAGIMGAGLAAEFRHRYPDMHAAYVEDCKNNVIRLGEPTLWTGSLPYILNFPTKGKHLAEGTTHHMLRDGLRFTRFLIEGGAWKIASLAVPALGCGLGGLDWHKTVPLLLTELWRFPIPVELYLPQ